MWVNRAPPDLPPSLVPEGRSFVRRSSMSLQPAFGQSRAAVPTARLRAVLGSLVLVTMVLVPLGASSVAVAAPAGFDWTSQTSAADNAWLSVTYGNGLFVAVAASGTGNRVMTSPDGITWTSRTSPADNGWISVTYGGGLFVAVSYSGAGNRVMTSPDGITWTSRTSPADNDWISVTYGNGLFVAVAASGTCNRVMTSPDGITWTIRTSAADNFWSSVTYGNGLFVAVSGDGIGSRVMTSPDGITWTSRTSPTDNDWSSVTYGGGLFVAVAGYGTGNQVMTSPDGITWTSRASAADNVWNEVTYGGGLFVAVSFSGIGDRVMTSPDGIIWTSRTPAADNDWSSVAYGGGLFVAVSFSGTGNRVMTSPPPPPPPPVYPPGAPTGLTAVAGDASASVSWMAPSDSGSYPMSTYQVTSAPGGRSCLVSAPALTCTVSGLTNGTSYTFTVRALNGAGWGSDSAPSNAVTPRATPVKAIQITGSRDASDTRVVRVSGTTTGLVGEQVTPWVRFPGQTTFTAGTGVRTVAADGTFEWSRATGKKVHAYFTHGSIKSNTVVIASR